MRLEMRVKNISNCRLSALDHLAPDTVDWIVR